VNIFGKAWKHRLIMVWFDTKTVPYKGIDILNWKIVIGILKTLNYIVKLGHLCIKTIHTEKILDSSSWLNTSEVWTVLNRMVYWYTENPFLKKIKIS